MVLDLLGHVDRLDLLGGSRALGQRDEERGGAQHRRDGTFHLAGRCALLSKISETWMKQSTILK